jgi:hypothetical protein
LRHSHTRKRSHNLVRFAQAVLLLLCIPPGLASNSAQAAELNPETSAAFDRYIAATEARMDDDVRFNHFLVVDRLADSQRRDAYEQLHRSQTYVQELHTQQDHHPLSIPNGLIHHWAGVIFIPNATLSQTIAVIEDYENDPNIYRPEIRRSKVVEHDGNGSKICLQFVIKPIVTVVLNVYFDVSDTQFGTTRRQATSRSSRIAEVANPGSPNEYERSDGNERGYIWRFNNYWRIEEKDGGVYVQNESVTLSRAVPEVLDWLINPFIKSIPRDIILDLLTDTRKAVEEPRSGYR